MNRAPSPYDFLPSVPSFQASSHDVAEGEMLAMPMCPESSVPGVKMSRLIFPGLVRQMIHKVMP